MYECATLLLGWWQYSASSPRPASSVPNTGHSLSQYCTITARTSSLTDVQTARCLFTSCHPTPQRRGGDDGDLDLSLQERVTITSHQLPRLIVTNADVCSFGEVCGWPQVPRDRTSRETKKLASFPCSKEQRLVDGEKLLYLIGLWDV